MRKTLTIVTLLLLTSCTRFEGRIEERILSPNDSIKAIFLLNKSTSEKYTFTIKQSSLSDNGTKAFQNLFYKLEPGEETQIGRSLVYSPQKYKNEYQIASFDTLTEVINFGKKIKIKKNVPLRNSIDFTYKTTHYKNGIEIDDPFDFWGAFSEDTKLIDSTKIGNTETKIYQNPVKVIVNRIPVPRSKTFYNYEITGQVLTK